MSATVYKNSGKIESSHYRTVTYTGKTKGGHDVVITLENALDISNREWTFAEKDDTVSSLEFEACYTDGATDPCLVPASVSIDGTPTTAADGILLGVGVFSIGNTPIALTRGGGSYTEEIERREVNADGDRGKHVGRVVIESVRAKLKLNALTFLKDLSTIYPEYTVQT